MMNDTEHAAAWFQGWYYRSTGDRLNWEEKVGDYLGIAASSDEETK